MAPQVILDTNVCSLLVHSSYSVIRAAVMKHISARFRIVVSATTFSELLNGLVSGGAEHFEINRDRLRIMAGPAKSVFLPYGLTFAVSRLLNIGTAVSEMTPVEWKRVFQMAMLARSKSELLNGNVEVPPFNRRYGFNAHKSLEPIRLGKQHHTEMLEQVRSRNRKKQTVVQWAKEIAKTVDALLDDEQAQTLGTGLEAAYAYDCELWHHALKGKYNFRKRDGDWVDQQQLYYLCDNDLHLLTDEANIARRCGRNNQQAERIILFRDYVRSIGLTPVTRIPGQK